MNESSSDRARSDDVAVKAAGGGTRTRLLRYVDADGALTGRGKSAFLPAFLVVFFLAIWLMVEHQFNLGVLVLVAGIVGLFAMMSVFRAIIAGNDYSPQAVFARDRVLRSAFDGAVYIPIVLLIGYFAMHASIVGCLLVGCAMALVVFLFRVYTRAVVATAPLGIPAGEGSAS
jgi:hypothetical protein